MQYEHKVVSKQTVLLAYQLLRQMEPFSSWKLPLRVETKVVSDASMYGCFEDSPNTITISTAKVWDVNQLVATVAHEMIHYHQSKLKILDADNAHDQFFMNCAREVCVSLGFDKENF
mgnify:CR=1 FL=1